MRQWCVISAASTGIASQILIGGGTVHRHFSVPIDINSKSPPNVSAETAKAEYSRNVELIIVDVSFLSFYTCMSFLGS